MMTIRLRIASWIVDSLLSPFVGEVAGAEDFPASGPCLAVVNHLSVCDGLILAAIANNRVRQFHFVSYRRFFVEPFIGHMLRFNQAIELDETTWEGRQRALQDCRQKLAEGRAVAIFPEGHTAPYDRMFKAQPGAAMLALETGVPVVPVGLIGTEKIVPRKGDLPGVRWKAVSARFGRPLDLGRYVELFARSDRRRRLDIALGVSTIIMRAVATLSGQVYPHGAKFLQRLDRLSLGSAG
jgi:1-acyl-sn-glycerol-3-phosphate acyltransferase